MRIENMKIGYESKVVLKDINWDFSEGKIVGIVAPNGRGKTTLFYGLMGQLHYTSGKLFIDEEIFTYPIQGEKNIKKLYMLMSMMVDQSHLIGHISGMRHLKFYHDNWKSSVDLEEIVQLLSMEHYIKDKVSTYSLGMRQRLCFAMQLVTDTKIMLMDEIMNGLDVDNVYLITKIIKTLKEKGKTIFIASHLLENLEEYADVVIFIKNQGELHIVEHKDNQKVVTASLYPEVADLSRLDGYEMSYHRDSLHSLLSELNSDQLYDLANSQDVKTLRVGKKSLRSMYFDIYFGGDKENEDSE